MRHILPSFVLGFHGCDISIKEQILYGQSKDLLKPSNNDYDWLGNGIYFWENDPDRALAFAEMLQANPKKGKGKINTPAVLGAVIELKNCLNLFEQKPLREVQKAYQFLVSINDKHLPRNKKEKGGNEFLLRYLDKAVIAALHEYRKINKESSYDTIRCPFWEGDPLYPTAGFREKNHVQLCVVNPKCIRYFFDPDIHY